MNEVLMLSASALVVLVGTIVTSFAGGGTSLVIFPMLLLIAPGSYVSLFVITKIAAVMMGISSSRIHFKKTNFKIGLLSTLVISGLLGTALGTYFLQFQFDDLLFKKMLTGFVFLTAIYLFFSNEKGLEISKSRQVTPFLLLILAIGSFAINILNGIFGGTGLFNVLLIVLVFRLTFINAIAYAMINYAIIGSVQALYLVLTEPFDLKLAASVVLAAFLGGFIGTKFQYIKGDYWVKKTATFMMLVVGISMLFKFFI
jgi:uncharacterized membrane protein YfcA